MLAASLWIPTPEQRFCKYWGQYFDSFSPGREFWNLSLSTGQNWFWLFTTGLKGNQTTIKGRMILGVELLCNRERGWDWGLRLRPVKAFPPSSCLCLFDGWTCIFPWFFYGRIPPITATGNSFTQSDGFTWVHIRRKHLLTSMILFRMASKPITLLF